MRKTVIVASVLLISTTYASVEKFRGMVQGSTLSCMLQTDIKSHKDDIDFYYAQRMAYEDGEILEKEDSFGAKRISLFISKGTKEITISSKRADYQPAEPLSAIDREFLIKPGSVFPNYKLEGSNLTYSKTQGPGEYKIKVDLEGIKPKSFTYQDKESKKSFRCEGLKLIP